MSRSRAYHGDRPYADLVVFKDGGKWCVRLAGKQVGPYPSKARALSAAIDTARLAESAGKSAQVLEQTGLTMDDIDLIEFNEAFAAQALAVIREVGMDLEKTNVNGGAIALGHPMGATGTKLTLQLIHEMKRRGSKYGLVTMCIGGGMGAAGIFENLQN